MLCKSKSFVALVNAPVEMTTAKPNGEDS